MTRFKFQTKDEENKFLKDLLNNIPAMVNVNQIDDINVYDSNFSLWSNQKVFEYTGFTKEEIDEKGFAFFQETMHPDDVSIIAESLLKLQHGEKNLFGGLVRIRSKGGDYKWFIGSMSVMETRNGVPWRIVVAIQNMEDMKDTQNQIRQLIKENLQLRNQLRYEKLSRREKEVVKLIAAGKRDKEIAAELFISPATVKTHRHKIIEKLQLKNKAAIAQFATESGID